MSLLLALVRTPLATVAGWALFHSLWQGAVVAAVLGAALAITRSARARYAFGCVALGAVLVSFGLTFAMTAAREQAAMPVRLRAPAASPLPQGGAGPQLSTRRGLAGAIPWAAPFWMAGVLLFYGRNLTAWAAARRLRRAGTCSPREGWQQRLDSLAARMRVLRPVLLLESSLAEVPVVIGHLRPVILIPAGFLAGLPPVQIELILLHELAHVRRYDYLVNLLQRSVEALLFYHPAVWWISGIVHTEREHCCDDLAVAATGDAREYAAALSAIEQMRVPHAALAATGGSLVKRIRRLLVAPEGPSPAPAPVFYAGILTVAAALSLAAWETKNPLPEPRPQLSAQAQAPRPQAPQPVQQAPVQATPQESPYLRWLNEDVVYIISAEERAAFLNLQTDDERTRFIEQFWLRRDPTPGTPENEFKEEHYRRIAYANLHFPTAQGTAGWRTDRGHIYILFGPPDERDEHTAGAGVPAAYDRWRYRFLEGIGTDVFIEFVDAAGTGEFRMTRDPNAR